MITFNDFQKIELKVGTVLSAEKVANSEKLLKLFVDFGEEIVLMKPAKKVTNGSNLG